MQQLPPVSPLLHDLKTLCERAGRAIMDVYEQAGDISVTRKTDASPLTAADMAAHRVLTEGLRDLLAGVPVLSEEADVPDYELRRQWQRYWLIDPMDGTKEFISRNGEFTVNVALVERGEPVLGVVHAPVLGVTYTGSKGAGAYKWSAAGVHAIRVRSASSRQRSGLPLDVVMSRRHGLEATAALVERLKAQFHQIATKDVGSSLKLCLVAAGDADLYPRLAPTCEWDTAAAQAVVEAAGGAVLGEDFLPLRYNQKASLLNPHFFVVGDTAVDWRGLVGSAG